VDLLSVAQIRNGFAFDQMLAQDRNPRRNKSPHMDTWMPLSN
jgi:hypothetical protein